MYRGIICEHIGVTSRHIDLSELHVHMLRSQQTDIGFTSSASQQDCTDVPKNPL